MKVYLTGLNYCGNMKRDRTDDQFERRSEYGNTILPEYYKQYVDQWNKIVSIERNFKTVSNGVPINGRYNSDSAQLAPTLTSKLPLRRAAKPCSSGCSGEAVAPWRREAFWPPMIRNSIA